MNDLSRYYKIQKEIRTGDHIGWKSNGIIGKLIRLKTGDTINHSSLALRLNYEGLKRRFDVGALNSGIELHILSKMLDKYSGEVWWYPLKDEYNNLRPRIATLMLNKIDTKYDYNSLFKNAFGRVSTELSKLFCSEYANYCWNTAGIDTGFSLDGKAPTPVDIDKFTIFKDKVRIL